MISLSTWPQYVLDNFATVAEAVADLRQEKFRVQTVVLGTGRPANMHLVTSDVTGDSAVFEYVEGKLVIHHGKQYRVVTNSPDREVLFDSALTPATFWVKLDELDLTRGAPVKKLHLAGGKTYSGNAVSQFVDAPLFTFQDLTNVAPAP